MSAFQEVATAQNAADFPT